MKSLRFFAALLLAAVSSAHAWDDRRLTEPLRVNGQTIPYLDFAVYLMPGAPLLIHLAQDSPAEVAFATYRGAAGGDIRAPDSPGLYPASIRNLRTGQLATLQVFVMTPASRIDDAGDLNGYRIGKYPDTPLRGEAIYQSPAGLVEVTTENMATRVSPNFTLGEFLCKQAGGFPKYVVLRASLLLKLESILAALNHSGRPTDGLVVMSAYRTPSYNAAIGSGAYSRHVWGGAADIYIDESPRDGEMDDLNGDGRVDRGDAEWLAMFINRMSERGEFGRRVGGLGVYGRNAAHGPFVHVDARGSRARW